MINIGSRRIKTLHKGNELITRIFKGDEKIYEDFEALYSFKFTIDTTLDNNGGHTYTGKQFSFIMEQSTGQKDRPQNDRYNGIIVYWGDGTSDTYSSQNTYSPSHLYDNSGVYQITVLPQTFNGVVIDGWLSGMQLGNNMLLSIDKAFPERSVLVGIGNWQSFDRDFTSSYKPPAFREARNIQSAPVNLFDNVQYKYREESPLHLAGGVFMGMFYRWGYNSGLDPIPLVKPLIQRLDTSNFENFDSLFSGTFQEACYKSTTAVIPADLFSTIDTTNGTSFSYMFSNTFNGFGRKNPNATIPAGLFSSIDTTNGVYFDSMFSYTFNQCCYDSTVATIPAGLFSGIKTSNGTRFRSMFENTFFYACYNSTVATIPAGLFSGIDTTRATDCVSMFRHTFDGCCYKSTVATIPADLLDGITSPLISDFTRMFESMFSRCCYSSTVATIPQGLLLNLSTSNGVNFYSTFFSMFAESCYSSPIATIPGNFISRYDFSSGTLLNYTFYQMFRMSCWESQNVSIPDDFLDIDISNGTDFSATFQSLFEISNYGCFSTIPATILSHLDFGNGKVFYNTFYGLFSYACKSSATATIPNGLFANLNINISQATDIRGMFNRLFYRCFQSSTVAAIPNDLFSYFSFSGYTGSAYELFMSLFAESMLKAPYYIPANLFDCLDGAKFSSLSTTFREIFASCFSNTSTTGPITLPLLFTKLDSSDATSMYQTFTDIFKGVVPKGVEVTIPGNLFATINTSSVTNVESMFAGAFSGLTLTSAPRGLFGGLDFTTATSFSSLFFNTFGYSEYRQASQHPPLAPAMVLEDVFDGMADFSWATAANASQWFNRMFPISLSNGSGLSDRTIGSASTILQHFQFTPNSYTYMFNGRTNLTDYNTIDAKWK